MSDGSEMKILNFRCVTTYRWVNNPLRFAVSSAFASKGQTVERGGLFEPEDESVRIIWNVRNYSPNGIAKS
jgi:hypothetical protein